MDDQAGQVVANIKRNHDEEGWALTDKVFLTPIEEEAELGRCEDWVVEVRGGYAVDRRLGPMVEVLLEDGSGDVGEAWTVTELRKARIRARNFTTRNREGSRMAIPDVRNLRKNQCFEHHDNPYADTLGENARILHSIDGTIGPKWLARCSVRINATMRSQ
jgi:hypothetical protein